MCICAYFININNFFFSYFDFFTINIQIVSIIKFYYIMFIAFKSFHFPQLVVCGIDDDRIADVSNFYISGKFVFIEFDIINIYTASV